MTNAELLKECSDLYPKIEEIYLKTSSKVAENVLKHMPAAGEKLTASQYASIRWELLNGGFDYWDVRKIMSKLSAISENLMPYPVNESEFVAFIHEKVLGTFDVNQNYTRTTLWLLSEEWTNRVKGPQLNAHEKCVIGIARRVNRLLAGTDEIEREKLITRIANDAKIQAEMVYRVATGGTKIPSKLLMVLDKAVRRIEISLEPQ